MARKEINTSIKIFATPNTIWKVLSNFKEYKNWNPFITSAKGEFAVGNNVEITAGGMNFKPVILTYDENREIRWLGKFLFKGLFDGEHSFQIIDNGDGSSTFEQNEIFNGILVGMFAKKLDTETKDGFEKMNQELKQLSENYS